jgi:hypothetical protein
MGGPRQGLGRNYKATDEAQMDSRRKSDKTYPGPTHLSQTHLSQLYSALRSTLDALSPPRVHLLACLRMIVVEVGETKENISASSDAHQ